MSKKLSFEDPTLFLLENGYPIVPVPGAYVSQEADTFAASCVYAAAVPGSRFRCPLSKCPQYLLNCF